MTVFEQAIKGAGEALIEIQRLLEISDTQVFDLNGLEPTATRLKRLRLWKTNCEEIPANHFLALKRLLAMDQAVKFIEDGEWDRAADVLRLAMPEELL